MTPTVAAKKPAAKALPYTGREYLDSLDDGREIWIYGERVVKITEHPAFQNCARMIARLYDALHEDHKSGKNVLTMPTESGGFTHRYFKAPTSLEEQVAGRDAIAEWARVTSSRPRPRPISRGCHGERRAVRGSEMLPTESAASQVRTFMSQRQKEVECPRRDSTTISMGSLAVVH
jgi:hypothetical protein